MRGAAAGGMGGGEGVYSFPRRMIHLYCDTLQNLHASCVTVFIPIILFKKICKQGKKMKQIFFEYIYSQNSGMTV